MPQRVRKKGDIRFPPKSGGKRKRSNPLPKETLTATVEAFRSANLGRPPVYNPGLDELARRFYTLGYDDKDFAELLGITEQAIKNWAIMHPSFMSIRATAKAEGDAEVEASLRSRALGYSHKATKIQLGPGGKVIETEYIQHYPPDPKSAELWLINRHRGRWISPSFTPKEGDAQDGIKITIVGGLPDD